jgi:hypothetical protein
VRQALTPALSQRERVTLQIKTRTTFSMRRWFGLFKPVDVYALSR